MEVVISYKIIKKCRLEHEAPNRACDVQPFIKKKKTSVLISQGNITLNAKL